ncbi:MAG TPA: cupin domain-containing protein [Polyangiales bacterium]|nr:cupin domain-containing protein [Polyangiales bacterium]
METSTHQSFTLDQTFAQLLDDGAARLVDVDPAFWREIGARTHLHPGRLVGWLRLTADSDHDEVHPAGDELLILVSGRAEVVLEGQTQHLQRGRACVVPRGAWHHLIVQEPGELIFVTPGAGTRTRSRNGGTR